MPRVLQGGIRTDESHLDPGLQLADLVAHIVWSAVVDPDDEAAIKVWQALGAVLMPTEDGWPMKIWGGDASPPDDACYKQLKEAL